MIKAVVKNGMIVPNEPLPEEWREGTHVAVEMANDEPLADTSIHPADAWMDEVEAIARQGDPADDLCLDAAIQAIRRREKDAVLDRWMARVQASADEMDPEDEVILERAIGGE